ncbi:sigma 54-interacting transcriptional regulator, partial [Acinetobacter variabilis]
PFIAINCGAIPAELMESELFGHKKGSFTGAMQDKQGLIQSTHGGSLFLDEIAELPLSMQVKLLRAVQEKRIRPLGSDIEIDV